MQETPNALLVERAPDTIRILIADDHAVVRAGLQRVLRSAFPRSTFGEADDGCYALDMALSQNWDAVILDLSMPGKSGLEVLAELSAKRPQLPVLMMSMKPEGDWSLRALRAGARAYLSKETEPVELVWAVRAALNGNGRVGGASSERRAPTRETEGPGKLPHERLSRRELQILRLAAAGMSAREIGVELKLSPKTVAAYRTTVGKKMELRTTAELTRYAFTHNLLN